MKIGYLTSEPASDIKIWSGTTKYIYDTLKKNYNVKNIVITNSFLDKFFQVILYKLFRIDSPKLNQFFINRAIKRHSKEIESCDTLFLSAHSEILGSKNFQFRSKKIIYLSDATYHLLMQYYNLSDSKILRKINEINEFESIKKATNIIYASDWAKKDAIHHYNADSSKISVIPFGANLKDEYRPRQYNNDKKQVNLLLVGVEWKRKGIDIAIETVKILNQYSSNIHYHLTVVGVNSDKHFKDVNIVGRLDKSNSKDLKKLINLYQNSDIFILPTKAECAGIVFCEASMFGLPSVTYNTGGISSYIKNGKNGFLLDKGLKAKDFAKKINEIVISGQLSKIQETSRKEYEERLNWNSWIKKTSELL